VTGLLTVVSDDPDFSLDCELCGENLAHAGVWKGVTYPVAPTAIVDNVNRSHSNPREPVRSDQPPFRSQPASSAMVCGTEFPSTWSRRFLLSTL
jgi:hypothetical protein